MCEAGIVACVCQSSTKHEAQCQPRGSTHTHNLGAVVIVGGLINGLTSVLLFYRVGKSRFTVVSAHNPVHSCTVIY